MNTKGRRMSMNWLTAMLLPLSIAVAAPVAYADDEAERAQLAQQERDRQVEERARQAEERERQREEARQRAEQAREQQRQRQEEQRERLEEEKERAKEEKERAKEELQRMKEEKQRMKEHGHHDCRGRGCDDAPDGKKSGRTTAKVKGPVRFSVEVVNADIQVTAIGKDTVSIAAKNCAPHDLELDGADDEFEGDFSEWGSCAGPVIVVVPVGSSVEVATVQGSLKLKGSFKEVEASSVAGSIEIESADDVEAESVQGKVKIGSARRAHVESVAGDVDIVTTGSSPIVDVETVNGNVRWSGTCAKGCRVSVESFQGSSALSMDAKASSFELRFATQNGKFSDTLGTQSTTNKKNVQGFAPIRARFGKAEGVVRVETYQGGLELKKTP